MLKASEIKRQILMESDTTGIAKRLVQKWEEGRDDSTTIEMGQAYETMTKTKGWMFLEAWILKHINIVGLVFGKENQEQKGIAQGLISLMQHMDQVIRAKDEILERISRERQTTQSAE